MKYPPEELLSRLEAGEDTEWEFKEVRFAGDVIVFGAAGEAGVLTRATIVKYEPAQ